MKTESVHMNSNGRKLAGHFYRAEKPEDLAFLLVHGWTGKPNEVAAKMLAEHGYTSMTFSMGGHGPSEGDINTQMIAEFLDDVVAAYDFLAKQLGPSHKIGAIGNSFGGYLALLLSQLRPVECLSLRVPANYKDEDFSASKMERSGADNPAVIRWRQMKLTEKDNKALSAIHDFRGQIQIIEGEKDEIVDHQTVQNYVDAVVDKSKLTYILWKNAPHSIGDNQKLQSEFKKILLDWVNTKI